MFTEINSEDRLVQATFADHLRDAHGWDSVYAWNEETFGPSGTLGRDSEREVVLKRDLGEAVAVLNPDLPREAVEEVVARITRYDASRSTLQHNREFYGWIRDGVPVSYRDERGNIQNPTAKLIDFRNPENNRFLAVRELKIQRLRTPYYNRRADLVCFVNGLPLVFFELKAVYKNIRAGFDGNLTDYKDAIPHAFYHNAFLVVSNGDNARYGTITSQWEHFGEWKRTDESEKGQVAAQVLLDGMLDKARLLDLVENFIAFDESKPGATRKVLARNHQVLGVNRAVASVVRQETLKRVYPPEKRLVFEEPSRLVAEEPALPFARRAHPDLGRLGVFWHTQGSGKSYSMVFFAEKVRRTIPGNFTFVIMTDREDLDDQIYRTFVGCGAADEKTPRAGTGEELKTLLQENHRYVFSLIHKFNQDVTPESPYSRRDDIIVISDEAHRTQAGKLARNMRLALPNASFIGFTGTPLFKNDELTRRIFGDYVSRYDFKRSEEDGATVKLIYENRGEKLGIARLDLNDRIRQKIDAANLDLDEEALLEKLLGKDYEIITADDRLDKIAEDFVEHCSTRWEAGKSMLVCIDKITCARMLQRILPRWRGRAQAVAEAARHKEQELRQARDPEVQEKVAAEYDALSQQARWMDETLIEIIISEGQNEMRDFGKWGFDIVPHRDRMKRGFETPDGRRVDVESAFKDPAHPFRVAIVCAMWLTGFDVECLSTLYIDKPMKAHTLMQAIARANRVYPGKACGVIVDYNGMLKALQAALAQYALGDDGEGPEVIIAPIEELVASLKEGIEATENHLRGLGFEPARLVGAKGFTRIGALRDAVEALYTSAEAKRRFEIMARETFSRFKALLMEPAAFTFAERHDNIEAIYKKLSERRDTADVTEVLKEIHKIVNEAIRAQQPGGDQAEGLTVDLSKVNFEKLRDEFAKKITRKRSTMQDMCAVVEAKLAQMLGGNPARMDYYKRYQEIVGEYNREKDRATVEETFARLIELAKSLDEEQQRAAREGPTEDELALFDLLYKERISKEDKERVKQSSKSLLAAIQERLGALNRWTDREQTKAEVKVFVLDHVYQALPIPPYTERQVQDAADGIYDFVWQQSVGGPSTGVRA